MSRITTSDAKGLMEAYAAVYAPQESLEQEIFETVSYTLISQGYTAIDVLEYFANVDEEIIIEDIVAIAEGTLLIESVVSEEYLQEQYEILSEALPAGLALAGRALFGAGAKRAATTVLKRMAGPGVRKAVGGVVKKIGGAVTKVKDVARGALNKLPGGSGGRLARGIKSGAKFALGGAALEAGMKGVGALMGGGKPTTAKLTPIRDKEKYNASAALGGKTAFSAGGGEAAMKKDPKLTAADIQKRGNAALRASAGGDLTKGAKIFKAKQEIMAGKPATSKSSPVAPSTPAAPAAAPSKPAAAAPVKAPAGSTETPKKPKISQDAEEIRQMQQRSKQRQGQLMGGPEGPGQIDKSDVEASVKAAQERERKKAEASTNKESYDAYDVVLEYLFSEGHVDTVDEAHYVMMEMDAETIVDIVEGSYEDRIAANNKKYDRNRKRAAQRASARNAARDAGQTGAVPGVGYVTPRRERETYTDSSGKTRHAKGL